MAFNPLLRQEYVQRWVRDCDCPGAYDVSSRWYGCVPAHLIVADKPLRGVAEMLSTHYLLVNDDSQVIFSVEISAIKSVERRQEVHIPAMSLHEVSPPVVRTFVELIVKMSTIKPDNSSINNNDNAVEMMSGPTNRRMSVRQFAADDIYRSNSLVASFTTTNAAAATTTVVRDGGGSGVLNVFDGAKDIPLIFVVEGAEGAHFANAMEILWRTHHDMLAVRDHAMVRCSHLGDYLYVSAMLPLDVDCVLQQQQVPIGIDVYATTTLPMNSPNSTRGSRRSCSAGGSRSGVTFLPENSPNTNINNNSSSAAVGSDIVNIDKPVVLRIDQQYNIHIIFRPLGLYDALGSLGVDPQIYLSTSGSMISFRNQSFSYNSIISDSSNLPTASMTPLRCLTFPLDDVVLITHNENGLRLVINDGRVVILSSFSTSVSEMLTNGHNGAHEDIGVGFNSSVSAAVFERRRQAALVTKSLSGVDVTTMSVGQRQILDVFLYYSSTACYQKMYLQHLKQPQLQQQPFYKMFTEMTKSGTNSISNNSTTTVEYTHEVIHPAACFFNNDLYRVYNHFLNIDENMDGFVSPSELFAAMGPLIIGIDGRISKTLYFTFDFAKKGFITLSDYYYGCRLLLRGSVRDRIRFLFNLFDFKTRGMINYHQFLDGMRLLSAPTLLNKQRQEGFDAVGNIEGIISGGVGGGGSNNKTPIKSPRSMKSQQKQQQKHDQVVSLTKHRDNLFFYQDDISLHKFCREFFSIVDTNGDGEIDANEFERSMTQNTVIMQALRSVSTFDETTFDGDTYAEVPECAVVMQLRALMAKGIGVFSDQQSRNGTDNNSNSNNIRRSTSGTINRCILTTQVPLFFQQSNMIVTFGHARWREIMQILAGVEMCVNSPEANQRVVDQRAFSVKVVHNCSSWGLNNAAVNLAMKHLIGDGGQNSPQGNATAKVAITKHHSASTSVTTTTNNITGFKTIPFQLPSSQLPNDTIVFNDYCPGVFNTIRLAFGITSEDYLLSLGIKQLRSSLLICNNTSLYEMVSSGRSGSFFYSSYDKRFVLKTIPSGESQMLRKILPQYYKHVLQYPDTLLPRFCGLHALHRNGQKVTFVIMQNIFLNKVAVHELYDLKGSSVNRSTPLSQRGPGIALKDNDWGNRKMYCSSTTKRKLLEQIAIDTELLSLNNLNDYSFLLGVHNNFVPVGMDMADRKCISRDNGYPVMPLLPQTPPPSPLCPLPMHNIFQQYYGGIRSTPISREHHAQQQQQMLSALSLKQNKGSSPPSVLSSFAEQQHTSQQKAARSVDYIRYYHEIYFVGLIDTLTVYGFKKKGEHYGKSIMYDSKEVSCVPPQEYKKRLLDYLDTMIIAEP